VPVVRGGFATTLRSLGSEGVGLGTKADAVVYEFDAQSSAGLFNNLRGCGSGDRESEGGHRRVCLLSLSTTWSVAGVLDTSPATAMWGG
jgi:hypothetical protein